jgi:molecular chaperone GrpE
MIGGMSREEILRRFEQWLDGALASEEPPRGIEADILAELNAEGERDNLPASDTYSLWAAMTALTQEIKLQGRTFKDLNDRLAAETGLAAERERNVQKDTERRCRKQALGVLIDLRERLLRGLETVRANEVESARAGGPGALARFFPRKHRDTARESITALKKGYELALERLDQAMDEMNAREIRCEGQSFDPRRMNAVDREASDAVPAGTVLEVYRSGYEWNGEVFRPAQVKVSCAPAMERQHE